MQQSYEQILEENEHLKRTIETLQERIKQLEYENENLKGNFEELRIEEEEFSPVKNIFRESIRNLENRDRAMTIAKSFVCKICEPSQGFAGVNKKSVRDENLIPISFVPKNQFHKNDRTERTKSGYFGGLKMCNMAESEFKFFEQFLIIGANSKELDQDVKDENDMIVQPEVHYAYPSVEKEFKQGEVLPLHVFPFGVKCQKMSASRNKISSIQMKLQSMILQTLAQNLSENEFVFQIQDYETVKSLPSDPFLKECNPGYNLYCICFQMEDFYAVKDPAAISIWTFPIVYCFVTYYPFISFFINLNAYLRNLIKAHRWQPLVNLDPENPHQLIEPDLFFTIQCLESVKEVLQTLDKIQNINIKFNQTYDIKDGIQLSTPSCNNSQYLEATWGSYFVFSYFSYYDILFLVTNLLLGQHLVLFSKNKNLISITMLTLLNLIKPFQYVCPMCFFLPEDCINRVACMVPYCFGVQGSYKTYEEELKENETDDTVYIDLDAKLCHYSTKQTYDDIMEYAPSFKKSLKNSYLQINDSNEKSFLPFRKSKKLSISKKLKASQCENPSPSHKQNQAILQEYELYKQCENHWYDTLIKHIPKQAVYIKKNQLDFKKINSDILSKCSDKQDKLFVSQFLEGQIFGYYLDHYYDSQE